MSVLLFWTVCAVLSVRFWCMCVIVCVNRCEAGTLQLPWCSSSPQPPEQRQLGRGVRGQRLFPESFRSPSQSHSSPLPFRGQSWGAWRELLPWAVGELYSGGGASSDLPESANKKAVHGGQHDDVTHQPRWQGTGAHDQLGQEDTRCVWLCIFLKYSSEL